MSTLSEREAALRRALHAAADAFEPGPDGLQRIQSRLGRPRPVAVAWAEAAWLDLRLWAPAALQTVLDRIASGGRLAWQRFGPTPRRSGHRAARPHGWLRQHGMLRPLAALGVTVFIVAAGAYVAIDAQQAIFPSSSNSTGSGGGNSGTGNRAGGGPGSIESHSQNAFGSGYVSASASCKPVAANRHHPAVPSTSSSAPAQSSTPTATPSTSSTDDPSPSPTDTGGVQIPYSSSSATDAPTDAPTLAPTLAPSSSASGPDGSTSAPAGPSHSAAPKATTTPCGS